ncbi:MAG: hypothetical protein IPN44_06150 [Flavobacteriales bacterium]|nr:hypothetical protein [Flavobacteriales bacterium]
MDRIGPHTYHYLHHPLFSSGEAMLCYTIYHLCFNGAISLDYSKVVAGRDNHHLVMRLFLTHVTDPVPMSAPQAFALSLFPVDRPDSLAELRIHMNRSIPDFGTFKSGPMHDHLMAKGLLFSTHILSSEGRAAYHELHSLLHDVEHEEVALLDNAGKLKARLDELGSNVVLLPEGFREKLRGSALVDPHLKAILTVQKFLESGGIHETKVMG